tara:strand:+ start:3940 stop:4122 length:183 start_codon:yes stop_codon:yes gene_type:complete
MKKIRNKVVKDRIAAKKGIKKAARKKVAKRHLEIRREMIAALRRREEKVWEEHYNNLMGL